MKSRRRALVLSVSLVALAPVSGALAGDVPFAGQELLLEVDVAANAVATDVDGDGDLDVVAYSDGALVWLEQTAGGSPPTFALRALIDQNAWTLFVPVDIDRDGDLDVALVYQNGDDAVVLAWAENDGTPANGAWARRVVQVWDAPAFGFADSTGLVAADFDGDGDPDLAIAHQEHDIFATDPDGRLLWMRSDGSPGNGGWSEEPLYDWILDRTFDDLFAADLDRDGDLDLVAQSWDEDEGIANSTSWWENDGSPGVGYWTRRIIQTTESSTFSPGQLAVDDLDRDGDPDLAVAIAPDPVRWYENDGSPANGGWIERDPPDGVLFGVRGADVDGDGDVDLAGGDVWLENDGSPADGGWSWREGAHGTFDLDGDGDLDGLSASFGFPPGVWWTENLTIHRSAKLVDEAEVASAIDGAYDLTAADIDGDGDLDLVSVSEGFDRVLWHENRLSIPGPWLTRTATQLADGARAVAAGDIDGDGDVDLVSASYNDDTVAWYESSGATPPAWTRRVISIGAGGAHDVTLADLDGDGDLDVACAQYLDDEVSWYRNDGGSPPTFSAFFVDSAAYDGPTALAAGDLDGDGDLDLAAVAAVGDTVVWYTNDGTPAVGEWSRHRTDNGEADSPRDVALADLDRDGDLDALVATYLGDKALWYENDGTLAGWTAREITTCNGPRGIAAGDFDRDGDLDALVSCYDDDRVKLQKSNGGAIPDLTTTVSSLSGANGVRSVVAADLDRDGDLDGAAAQGTDDTVAWYENRGGQFLVEGTAIAVDPLVNDAVRGLFRAVVTHRGRAGDGQIELDSVAVGLEEAPGDPMNAFQAASLIDEVRVYGDDGDALFEPGVDPLLAGVSPAGIDGAGTVWVDLPDGAASVAIAALAQKTYFVALDLADPFLFAAPHTLRATLLTDGASVCEAEDRSHDIELELEWRANVATATLSALDVLFRDSFETGGTGAWSDTVP